MGDFNYDKINWKNGRSPNVITNPTTAYVATLGDLCLHRHIKDVTHYKADQHPNTLDLVISMENGMIDNLNLKAASQKNTGISA